MAVVEGIIVNGVTEILLKLSSVVETEITLAWDFKDELKNLQRTLEMILAAIEDAEKKQLSSNRVRLWMEDLKSIAYDAEDVLDDYSYEVILWKREKKEHDNSSTFHKVCNICSSSIKSFVCSWNLAHQIKEINERFKIIANRKNDLDLLTINLGSSSSSRKLMMNNRETNSIVHEDWRIVGRENDKSTIIKRLLEEEGGGKHVSVIPIVGMGGLGKTTMAQQVYNDAAVQKHFELKIWICVSDPFDIKNLWKDIATKIGIDMADIARSLQNAFRGKKFLLVLDDVWNEKPADWNNFKKPFMVGREGSKILVTTRNEKVALIMVDKFQPYSLSILNDNDCWSIFKEIAFGSAAGAEETPNLVEIGKIMVNRCKGLPLAVIFLGRLMRSKKKEEEWKIIRDTKLWHESREGKNSEILPSLRLSYDYLPSHLKLCFSYCCLFPKDWIIKRERLIRLWMAEGFLIETPEENTMSMEEIGNEYFHSLLSGFFFQDVEKDGDGDIVACKMHDLVHDLARSVVGNHECLIVENARAIDYISEETRRLNLLVNLRDEEMLAKVLEALNKAKKLRTVFVNKQYIRFFDIGNAFKENKRMRVLDLSGSEVTTESISSSIGGLKHLRYFAINEGHFPKGGMMIGRLSFLQTLSFFTVGDKEEDKNAGGIEELEGLNLLTGDLTIVNLQYVTSGTEACRANLKKKKSLRGLNLYWFDGRNARNHEAVLEGLQPHPNLRTLKIHGFQGSKLPRWIQEDSSYNLPSLRLPASVGGLVSLVELRMDKTSITELPNEIENLTILKKLVMRDCELLSRLPDSIGNMSSLTTFHLMNANITELPESIGLLKKLEVLNVDNCKRLSRLPTSFGELESLRELRMERTGVTYLPKEFGMLSRLMVLKMSKRPHYPPRDIEDHNTKTSLLNQKEEDPKFVVLPDEFSNLSLLYELDASYCKISGIIPDAFEKLSSLKDLKLNHNNFCRLPSSMRGLVHLKQLSLSHCTKLKLLPPLPSSLDFLDVTNCTALESISDLSNLENLLEMQLTNCKKVTDIPGLECLNLLKRLYLGGCSACFTSIRRRLDKVALKGLRNLCVPGSEIPSWLIQEVPSFLRPRNREIKGVIICVVISLQQQECPDDLIISELPFIPGIEAKIIRNNKAVFSTTLDLTGVPDTSEDQICLCRYEHFHPLVSLLKEGDNIQVAIMRNLPIFQRLHLKKYGIHLVFEDDDDNMILMMMMKQSYLLRGD